MSIRIFFPQLSISVYILKSDSVSNGENDSPPNFSANSVSNCKILSKSENLSNPENLKTTFKNLSNNSALSKTDALSDNYKPLFCQTCTTLQVAVTIGVNVGSYTQVRIAGDFLSSRKTARAERCTPKTTAAALDG